MRARLLQLFSILLAVCLAAAAAAALQPGSVHRLAFQDVDGQDLSTASGQVTILVVITRDKEDQARAVSDLIPLRYVGDLRYRYVTLVNFQGKLPGIFHGLTRSLIRGRLDVAADRLRDEYAEKGLTRNPRQDVHVVADFDGSATARLGLSPQANELAVFVFNRQGKLIAQWTGVPPGDELPKAIAAAE